MKAYATQFGGFLIFVGSMIAGRIVINAGFRFGLMLVIAGFITMTVMTIQGYDMRKGS